jgi:RsiW-degrading membrane proteinase PrsW (M82 family)
MPILPLIIATVIPVVVLYVIYALDLYKMGAFHWVLACFAWGLVAFLLARTVNRYVYFQGYFTVLEIQRYFAPVVEELLKAAILVYLVRRPNFTYFVDGAIYGFAVGIGFAVFENWEYILVQPDAGFGVAVSRVISVNLMHASATAMVGIALGLARFRRTGGHIALLLGGLGGAILLHMTFNNLVTRDIPGPLLVYSTVLGFAAVGFIAFVIFRGLAEQRKWIEESLGMDDRVTSSEAKVVHRIEDIGELLKPLRQTFGDKKGDQIEAFLMIEARLGIQRKTLEKLPDPKMRAGVEKLMADLRVQLENARRQVGAYAMLYVRNIFPEDTSPVWNLLENRIQERIVARQETPGGANLFTSLNQRIATGSANAGSTTTPRPIDNSGSSTNQAEAAKPASAEPVVSWADKIKANKDKKSGSEGA